MIVRSTFSAAGPPLLPISAVCPAVSLRRNVLSTAFWLTLPREVKAGGSRQPFACYAPARDGRRPEKGRL
jgi:hypothetical protein